MLLRQRHVLALIGLPVADLSDQVRDISQDRGLVPIGIPISKLEETPSVGRTPREGERSGNGGRTRKLYLSYSR